MKKNQNVTEEVLTSQSPVTQDSGAQSEGQTPDMDGGANTPEASKKLKLNYGITFKVGFAFAIICMFWGAYDFVVPLLLENAYGLPNWARGLVMGLDNLLSLFMLPLFGKISDKASGKLVKKLGRRTPFIVIGTICAVVLMVFVPIVTIGQQKNANAEIEAIEAKLNDDAFMQPLLTEWYENSEDGIEGSKNFCDIKYLNNNDISKEEFVAIRFDDKMTSKKAILNFIGAVTYSYEGEEISDLSAVEPVSGKTYQEIIDGNANYKKFVASGINNYRSDQIHDKYTTSNEGIKSLAIYMVILLLVLIAMATFRSPAVALMPDVTPKPLRSQANAVINLCGGIGGAIAFLIYTIVLFGTNLYNYVIIFGSVAAGMLLLLAGFLALVKERKLVARCQEICKEYGIDDFDEEESEETKLKAEKLLEQSEGIESGSFELDGKPDGNVEEMIDNTSLEFAKGVVENSKKSLSPKDWWNSKTDLEKGRLKSFWLILASIFMWFMGYNAISSNLSVYTTKALNLSAGIASIISGVSMGVSAIAFIPVGYLAVKIGRRKSIMLGFGLAVLSFVLICFVVTPQDNAAIPAALFAVFYLLAGFGLIIANVNTFPMVTELSTAETVGQYTGYYYMATMSAQAITPMLGGLIMDFQKENYLFLYGAICIVAAILLMLFVKHGDGKQIPGAKKMSKDEKKQVRLDALENA